MAEAARWKRRLELLEDAMRALGTEAVDLVILADVPAALGQRILRDGKLIAERDGTRRVEVVVRTLRRYFDEEPIRCTLDAALAERVRKGRFGR